MTQIRDKNEFLQQVLEKAKTLQRETVSEKQAPFLKRLRPLLSAKNTKFFLIKLLDTALRPSRSGAVNGNIQHLFKTYPKHWVLFSPFERFLVFLYKTLGKYFPFISVPLIVKRIKSITDAVVFDLDSNAFVKKTNGRKSENIKQNINLIGEALLGAEEAAERIKSYKSLINNPRIDYISIKISTIYSQISSIAYEETLEALKVKLRILYDESMNVASKTGKQTFINLDMEEFRDLSLTVDLFQSLLSEEKYKNLYAGIVLQAYIPDSFHYLKRLQNWANARVKKGGSPIKIRIVKGANLEMEMYEASLKDWPQAPHDSKLLVDAQYKKMLLESLTAESCKGVRLGVASHNIFDISFALSIIEENNLYDYVDLEMLEGLAENFIIPLKNHGLSILLYTPVIKSDQFLSAIAYLVRRFDEATAKGNFLRESVDLSLNSKKWNVLQKAFENSYHQLFDLDVNSKRVQNRLEQRIEITANFENSVDTDWNLKPNRDWAKKIREQWKGTETPLPAIIPEYEEKKNREIFKMTNWNGALPWDFELADLEDYQKAIEKAKLSSWNTIPSEKRFQILKNAGKVLEEKRADLIGVGVSEVGKLIIELDVEISEAVDFANYYAHSMQELERVEDLNFTAQGINLVLSPWNFPIAIPAGGILASLAAGNTVIIKPAKRSIACAYVLVNALWEAGIPKDALFLLPTHSGEIQSLLKENSPFSSVILTGGTDTAKLLLNQNPALNLYAETGGKNATIVTSFADKDLAIKNIIDSSFNNTGQKCSATSLLILEKEVYESPHFFQLLKDATKSRKVGSPWDLDSKIGPMANPVEGKLKEELETKREWLLKGEQMGDYLASPSIALDISENDSCFKNELFGPHLSVIKVDNLEEAINVANQVSFGLTSGIESLDENETNYWKENIQAGNLYINRSTTGAIVKRQPFGGVKLSNFGPGMKAGGKNYLLQFLNSSFTERTKDVLSYAKESFTHWKNELFDKEIDEVNIRGQANILRYLKPDKVLILVSNDTQETELDIVKMACGVLEIPFVLLSEGDFLEDKLMKKLNWNTRIRSLTNNIPNELKQSILSSGYHIYDQKPIAHGRVELLHYLQEQSISDNYHRYGNLMGRKEEG